MEAMKKTQAVSNTWTKAIAVLVAVSAISTLHEGRGLIVQALLPTWYQSFGDELFLAFAGVALFMRGWRRLYGSVIVLMAMWIMPLVWWVMSGAVEPDMAAAVASEAQLVAMLMILTAVGLIVEELALRRHRHAAGQSCAEVAMKLDGANHG